MRRFLAGEAEAEPGMKILGRWHSVDLSIGFTVYESDNAAAHYAPRPNGPTSWTSEPIW